MQQSAQCDTGNVQHLCILHTYSSILSCVNVMFRYALTTNAWKKRKYNKISNYCNKSQNLFFWCAQGIRLLCSHGNHRGWWGHLLIETCPHPESQPWVPHRFSLQNPLRSLHILHLRPIPLHSLDSTPVIHQTQPSPIHFKSSVDSNKLPQTKQWFGLCK